MELRSGRVIGNVRKLPMGSSYVIKTPKGMAKVKGDRVRHQRQRRTIVVSGKVKYTDRTNGREVLIAAGEKYVGGPEKKAAEGETAAAAAGAPANNRVSPLYKQRALRQGVGKISQVIRRPAQSIRPCSLPPHRVSSAPWLLAPVRSLPGSAGDPLDAATGSALDIGQE
ncbi:MAG: hypothetical protein CM1200mP29_14370 [Verrucomicrobiota bacterium]|nr:MAG: hypothetical protein CM1200mP29_14370 [Verrucomicrobiota bacterium]